MKIKKIITVTIIIIISLFIVKEINKQKTVDINAIKENISDLKDCFKNGCSMVLHQEITSKKNNKYEIIYSVDEPYKNKYYSIDIYKNEFKDGHDREINFNEKKDALYKCLVSDNQLNNLRCKKYNVNHDSEEFFAEILK